MTDALESEDTQAPPRVKSRIYSALVTHLADTGPLKSLSQTASAGRSLCIFESPPIFWPHCPYAQFHRGS